MANKADDGLTAEFGQRRSDFAAAARDLEDRCKRICSGLELKDAWVSKRVKDAESFAKKLGFMRSKGQPYRTLDEVPDLAGGKIVVDNREQAAMVTRRALQDLPVDLPLTSSRRLAVDQLGYRARHLIVRLHVPSGNAITCELQIRTLLQHAWAQSQRNMDVYKGKLDPPERIKRQLNVLSGLLEMADDQLAETITDNKLIHAYPGIIQRITRSNLRTFIADGPMGAIIGRQGVSTMTISPYTGLSDAQLDIVVHILRDNGVQTLRDVAINLFEHLPMLQEVLAWPEPMPIVEPAVIVLVTSLVAHRSVRDMAQVPFLTRNDQSEIARRLGAQNPGYF